MKNIMERDELKDDSAEFLISISEAGLQHWCGQSQQHCPCLMLHSAHIPNSVKDADVPASTQVVTATSLRPWVLCFPSQGHSSSQ